MARSLRVFFAVVVLFGSTSVFAQSARVFVASSGSDLNPCSLASPCRSFSYAITQVASGGEIIPLDSAGYGTLEIDRSVSIAAPEGIYAGITASTPGTIAVNVVGEGLNVFLRGLTINGTGAATGVGAFSAGTLLRMERMNIANFVSVSIDFENAGLLLMSDCTLSNSHWGVYVAGASGSAIARATLDRIRGTGFNFSNSTGSLVVSWDYSFVTVHDSVSSGSFRGFEVYNHGELSLENCVSTHNVVGVFGGVQSSGSPVMYVTNSVIEFNTLKGIEAQAAAMIISRGDNTVLGNASAETFSGTFLSK